MALEQRATKAEADLKKAQEDASANATKVNELDAELKAIKDEKHARLVASLQGTVEAGIAGEEKTDREMLAALDDKNLKLFTIEAGKIAKVVSLKAINPPKTSIRRVRKMSLQLQSQPKEQSLAYPK